MDPISPPDRHLRMIRLWLLAVSGLVFVMVLVGGATRVTESGLSIVEWQPVLGVLPPLSPSDWQHEFEKYQTIPHYRLLNRGMSLDDFKTIYWWEWTHRLLGRVIGVVFVLPFLLFLWRGWIGRGLRSRLWLIFALGAVQGAVGWWMVASGLADRTEVSPYRLAMHLILACIIFAASFWTAQQMVPGAPAPALPRGRATALVLLGLVLLQIYFGALLAGLRGGLIYNTWPLIDGGFVPPPVAALQPGAVVAQLVRKYPRRAIRASHDCLCALARCRAASRRSRAQHRPRPGLQECTGARDRRQRAGEPRHPGSAPSGAGAAGAAAPGNGDDRAGARGRSRRATHGDPRACRPSHCGASIGVLSVTPCGRT